MCQTPEEGNPINVSTGDKVERVTDYIIPGARSFKISRTYRSSLYARWTRTLGSGWSFDHDIALWSKAPGQFVLYFDEGQRVDLVSEGPENTQFSTTQQLDAVLSQVDAVNNIWELSSGDGRTITFERASEIEDYFVLRPISY